MRCLSSIAFVFLFALVSVNADFVLFESNEYLTGILGSAPFQSYYSSESTPAAWNFVVPPSNNRSEPSTTPGYLFVAPRSTVSSQHGAVIYAQDGTMVWDGKEYGDAMAFKVVIYMGEPHICFWQGEWFGLGLGSGHSILLNQKYEVVANYTTDLDGETGRTYADFHETDVTVNNTAILAAYQLRTMDLTVYGGSSSGWILDSVVQELNITSGQGIWSWKASDYVNPSECIEYYPWGTYNQTGDDHDTAWDYFHINSIEKDNLGNYLISSRHCSAIYYLDGSDGHVIWKLGGSQSSFFMEEGTQFTYQHDARWLSRNDSVGSISLFNNAGLMAGVYNEDSARGMIIELDFGAMSATLIHDYLPWSLAVSETQGSTQVQPNGDVLIGWGSMPWVSEHSPSGELLWAGQFGVDTTIGGYRALRYNWTGSPMTKPSIELVNGRSSILSVYASWNGATEIQRWELFGALDAEGTNAVSLYNRTKNGFETTITIPTNLEMYEAYTHFAMRALDKENQPLGQSTFVSLNGVLGFTISTRSQWWIAVAMASVWILQWIL